MNSKIFQAKVFHTRIFPKRHIFSHRVFYILLDLAEKEQIQEKIKGLSFGKRWAPYKFLEEDHLCLPKMNLKESLDSFLKQKDPNFSLEKTMLLTHLRTWGYIFNPISLYFCYGKNQEKFCVAQVGNTFGEMKLFAIPYDDNRKKFYAKVVKNYYVSPFIPVDALFEFDIPDIETSSSWHYSVKTYGKDKMLLNAQVKGHWQELTDSNLYKTLWQYPFVTLFVILGIHYHAMRLYFKKIPFFRKNENQDKQKGAVLWKK
ncbi:MAG: DUF1365 domain-containing protein [Bacteriovoracaceae bacterium]|nr:DUF1365 domain-containing protein [Bacteriovoracaceae bacterium]